MNLLISRSQNPDDLLNRDTPIRDVLIRSMFNNIRLNRVAMNLATDLERADAVSTTFHKTAAYWIPGILLGATIGASGIGAIGSTPPPIPWLSITSPMRGIIAPCKL